MRICDYSQCGRPHEAKGYCKGHYWQLRKHGELRPIRRYARGTLADRIEAHSETAESGCIVWTASLDTHGYGQINVDGEIRRIHRVAWELAHGVPGPGRVVDHVCGNRKCLNVDHLREVSSQENIQYRTVLNANNTSGYRGVTRRSDTGKWGAQVVLDGARHALGNYETAEDAAAVAAQFRRDNYRLGDCTTHG